MKWNIKTMSKKEKWIMFFLIGALIAVLFVPMENKETNVQMTGADKIKLCITWFAHATGEADETTFTDYDIRIYNSAGEYLALGGSLDNNLEVLEFMAPYTDTYTIKIYQHDTTTLTERIGLAYQIVQA